MSGMDQFLAEYYGTGAGQATNEVAEETKVAEAAQIELFAKMAAAEGIDLESLTDEQVEQLYAATFSKEAGENPFAKKEDDGEKKEEKKEEKSEDEKKAAAAEFEEKKAEAEKVAEADFLGRVMAHAYVQELNKIAEAQSAEGSVKEALSLTEVGMKARHHGSKALEAGKKGVKAVGEAFSGKKLREGLQAKKNNESPLGKAMSARAAMHAPKGMRDSTQKAIHEGAGAAAKDKIRRGAAETGAAYGGAALAAGGAAAAAKGKKKESSAIDELAADLAVEKAAAAGWDAEEAAERMNALLVLGASEEGSKVASAENVEQAVDIRSSELLELAGYPVTWE